MNSDSPRFVLNSVDLWKSFRGFLVTILAAFLTWVASIYMDMSYVVHLKGQEVDLAMIAIPVIGGLIEIGRRFVTDHTNK